jgi:hypothetical protein
VNGPRFANKSKSSELSGSLLFVFFVPSFFPGSHRSLHIFIETLFQKTSKAEFLFELTFPRRLRFFFLFDAWFFIMFMFACFGQNARALAVALKPAECGIQGFILANSDFPHILSLPPLAFRTFGSPIIRIEKT